jgi:ketosteroid isomerase-like protein
MKCCYPCFALLLVLCMLVTVSGCTSMTAKTTTPSDEEQIWALEYAYFANLYKADYDGVLNIVHRQFLGWPDGQMQPVDYDESALFMRQLITSPTPCTVSIDRKGIRLQENVALTQYVLNASCSKPDGTKTTKSSDVSHTWVKEGSGWKILGGMSRDW